MIIRIVKLTFDPAKVEEFQANFHKNKELIRAVKGCNRLELLRDVNTPNIFMTYSWWDGEEYLEAYRHSDLFKSIWAVTKPMFIDKPEAWSVKQLAQLA